MSNFLAIATVTAALRRTLEGSIGIDLPGAMVTTQRPEAPGSDTQAHVNLYLYQVAHNAAKRNDDLPTRRADGGLVQRPQVALDLYYLLSFYGNENQLEPQRLLGSVVRTLHARPILTRQMILNTINDTSFLANSNLADEIELVKFAPTSLSTEELSKLWSVLFQVQYTLSVAYQSAVVLIESEDTPQKALPVRERNHYVFPYRQPFIDHVVSPDQLITAGSTLVIHGNKLRGDITLVQISGIEVLPISQDVKETQISLPVPPGLKPGIQGVQVIHEMMMGTPPVPHRGVESNIAAFVLNPIITSVNVSNVQDSGNDALSADLTIHINMTIGKAQRIFLLLNEISSGIPEAHTFVAVPRNADVSSITIPVSGVKAAEYLVQMQADGATSPLTVDTNPASPTFNQYIGPKVTIP